MWLSIVWVVFCQDVEKATQGCNCGGCVVARAAVCGGERSARSKLGSLFNTLYQEDFMGLPQPICQAQCKHIGVLHIIDAPCRLGSDPFPLRANCQKGANRGGKA